MDGFMQMQVSRTHQESKPTNQDWLVFDGSSSWQQYGVIGLVTHLRLSGQLVKNYLTDILVCVLKKII